MPGFPGLAFYSRFIFIVWKASVKARRGLYSDAAWSRSSLDAVAALERTGMRFCVIIGNHMSVMEAVILPASTSSAAVWKNGERHG